MWRDRRHRHEHPFRHPSRAERRAAFQEWIRRYPGHYFRFHLRRRLFFWFAFIVLLTAGAVATMAGLTSSGDGSWRLQVERARTWVGHQFASTWDDPARREMFARQTAEDLAVDLELFDASGGSLEKIGQPCAHGNFDIPVDRAGARLGTVRVCTPHAMGPIGGRRFLMGLAVVVALLWFASGRMSRRLARPMDDLVRTVQKIGEGDLKARAEVRRRDGEFGVVAEAVNEMAARIEKLMAEQRELLAAVSHELRTPLSRMRLLTEIARGAGVSEKTCDDLDREVVEMDQLVGQLLAHSRVEFGALQKRRLLVSDAVGSALERAGLKRELLDSTVESLEADPTLLARALANLFDNAQKHGGGATKVVVREQGGKVSLAVHDAGPGIPKGEEAKVFEPFHRGDHAREGLGLGLALVQRIAQAHGGRAWAQGGEQGGAIVAIELPLGNAAPPT